MLLLTSIILLIGFFALSGMVLRVAQLPDETVQESRRPIDLEADAVAEGVQDAVVQVESRVPPTSTAGARDAFRDAVLDTLDSVAQLEQGRGFRFELVPDPVSGELVECDVTDPLEATAYGLIVVTFTFTLQDLDTRVQATASLPFGTKVVGDPVEDRRGCW